MKKADLEETTHIALETAGGDYTKAGELLGITHVQLRDRVRKNKRLSARWSTPKDAPPPGEAVAIHRPTEQISDEEAILPTELEVAEAFKKEDELVKRGLSSLMIPGNGADLAKVCADWQRNHWRTTLDSMGGGINRQFWIVQVELDKINSRLELDIPPQEQFMLREDRARLLDILAKFHDKTTTGLMIQAKIHQMVNGKANKKAQKPKGFLNLNEANEDAQ